jgi:hypothetical protein
MLNCGELTGGRQPQSAGGTLHRKRFILHLSPAGTRRGGAFAVNTNILQEIRSIS